MLNGVILASCLALWIGSFTLAVDTEDYMARALQLMSETPLIDGGKKLPLKLSPLILACFFGHNDLPWQLRKQFNNQLNKVDLNTLATTHTNIPKIKAGRLGAEFWSAYVPCDTQYKDAVRQTLEQIDVIHRMCQKYPDIFMFATSSEDIMEAFKMNKTASLIGVEGGHSIDSSLGTLRMMYQLGVRYLTLTHSCNTPWADNWLVDTGSVPSEHHGLSPFGKQLIVEMNRLGMLIDLAHVTVEVMNQVLDTSKAPVIFSHSSAYAVCPNKRNVPDDVLRRVKETQGIVMVNFYSEYVSCSKTAKLSDVADHFDHIKKVAGASIIGFGGDYDGIKGVPEDLEDVSKFPSLVAELLRRGWTDEDVKAALGNNLLRVMRQVEKVRDSMNSTSPDDVPIAYEDVQNPCRTSFGYPNAGSVHSLSTLAPLLTLALQAWITLMA